MDLVEISNSVNQHVIFFWIDLYANTPTNYEIKTAISCINQRDEDHFKGSIYKVKIFIPIPIIESQQNIVNYYHADVMIVTLIFFTA